MVDFLGFSIERKPKPVDTQATPIAPSYDDGAIVVQPTGGAYGYYLEVDTTAKNENDLIIQYRTMSLQPEIEQAVTEIVNQAIVRNYKQEVISINLDNTKFSTSLREKITVEFNNILKFLDFTQQGYDIFRRWYIDGRLYFYVIIDAQDPDKGIQRVYYVDPRTIRKVRIKKQKQGKDRVTLFEPMEEFYLFNEKGFSSKDYSTAGSSTNGLKLPTDTVVYITSGLTNPNNTLVLSYLHKAIKPLNQLRVLEDASVIYRLARAPERRIFYVDVGNLPKAKAEQYLESMMVKHRNKVIYNADTGQVKDDRRFMTILEDYWMPRREGNKSTEIETLPGGSTLGVMDDIKYFKERLYESLNVPVSRMDSTNIYTTGHATEITREEVKFNYFIERLRTRFSALFLELLKRQLILKKVITTDEWEECVDKIVFDYVDDNFFTELRDIEIFQQRINTAAMADPYIGRFFSEEYVRKTVLKQPEELINRIDEQISREAKKKQEQAMQDMAPPGDGQEDPQGGAGPAEPADGGNPQETGADRNFAK